MMSIYIGDYVYKPNTDKKEDENYNLKHYFVIITYISNTVLKGNYYNIDSIDSSSLKSDLYSIVDKFQKNEVELDAKLINEIKEMCVLAEEKTRENKIAFHTKHIKALTKEVGKKNVSFAEDNDNLRTALRNIYNGNEGVPKAIEKLELTKVKKYVEKVKEEVAQIRGK